MPRLEGEEAHWAQGEFGRADLRDARRTARLVRMAARAANRPSGKVCAVFDRDAERQGAYDFLEDGHVDSNALLGALGSATAERAACEPFAFVAIDGSSIKLTDRAASKDFGRVGTLSNGARGLKMITALGISPQGVPLGLFAQCWWSRPESERVIRKRVHNRKRKVCEKETQRWLDAIDVSTGCAQAAGAKLWFLLDREGDNQSILHKLEQSGHRFTVRSSWNRLLEVAGHDKQYLRQWLERQGPSGQYELEVPAGFHRSARVAHMVIRVSRVVLRMKDKWTKKERRIELAAVWSREEGTRPPGEKALDWLLLTNERVGTLEQAQYVLFGYAQRWRIEEFHKTWKTGCCNVELTQLRSARAVILWAIILAAVAARVERLKRLARTTPEQPASLELNEYEVRALILLKRQTKKRTETVPDTMPSIGQATLWIAELGCYTGKSSGGPPGSITIRRGLEVLRPAALLLEALDADRRSDQ